MHSAANGYCSNRFFSCPLSWVVTLLLTAVIFLSGCFPSHPQESLILHMLDVDQGDCFLITTPEGINVLIDGGDPSQGNRVVDYLRRQGVTTIHHLVATHPHADHIGGLPAVLEAFQVDQVYMPPVVHTSRLYLSLLDLIEKESVPLSFPEKQQVIHQESQITIQILATGIDYGTHLNNWSLPVHVTHGNQSFLFTGDAEEEAERDLVSSISPDLLDVTVLKAGHHGSHTSTTPLFLEAASPEILLISCGKDNAYGHPGEEVLRRLNETGIHIYRTDLQGTVVLYSMDHQIRTYQAPSNLQP